MTGIDIIILVIMGLSVLLGLLRGIIRTVFSLLGFFFGFIVAMGYGQQAAAGFGDSTFLRIAAYVVLFFVTALIFTMVGHMLRKLLKLIRLGWLDNVLGGVFGLVRGVLLAGVLAYVLLMASEQYPEKFENLKESVLCGRGIALIQELGPIFPDAARDLLDRARERWDGMSSEAHEFFPGKEDIL